MINYKCFFINYKWLWCKRIVLSPLYIWVDWSKVSKAMICLQVTKPTLWTCLVMFTMNFGVHLRCSFWSIYVCQLMLSSKKSVKSCHSWCMTHSTVYSNYMSIKSIMQGQRLQVSLNYMPDRMLSMVPEHYTNTGVDKHLIHRLLYTDYREKYSSVFE